MALVAFGRAFGLDDAAGFEGRARSAGSRDSTLFFEQIGQSAVKRLWRQKSDVIRSFEGTPCQDAAGADRRPLGPPPGHAFAS